MRTVRTVRELRAALGPARVAEGAGSSIGFVPTMGALHGGHISLIEAARRRCDTVVVSIFVNPTQFEDSSDLARYPRQERRDAELAQAAGADILFVPSVGEIYPAGFATSVQVSGPLTERLEGASRGAAHFRGVCTVVCKLLNIVRPDMAFFGRKDAQQAAVISQMARDLDMDVQIVTLPTVRERDGLAMSSRNARLEPQERERALALHAALEAAQDAVAEGERSTVALRALAERAMASRGIRPEYVEVVDSETFHSLTCLQADGLMVVAARIGQTRLIDNVELSCRDVAQNVEERRTPHTERQQGDVIPACSA